MLSSTTFVGCVGELISKAEAQQRTKEYEEDEIESMFLLHLRSFRQLCYLAIGAIPQLIP